MELIALDKNLRRQGAISFKSLIWIDRYNRVGSCEIYAPATAENLAILTDGRYIARTDRKNVFQLKYIKIFGDEDDGVFVTAYGYDVKSLLDQRINTGVQQLASENAGEDLAQLLWTNALGPNAASPFEKADGSLLFSQDQTPAPGGSCAQAILFQPWGSVTRQVCGYLGYGYSVELAGAAASRSLVAKIYAGQDRSAAVRFSTSFGNLGPETYEHDSRQKANVLLIKAMESDDVAIYGDAAGTDRCEQLIEVNVGRTQTYQAILDMFTATFSLQQGIGHTFLVADDLLMPIISTWHKQRLTTAYPSGTIEGDYYRIPQAIVAQTDALSTDVAASTVFTVQNVVFDYLLLSEAGAYTEAGQVTETVNAEIIDSQFVYGVDYFLGDIVLLGSRYRPAAKVRIVEVLECFDDNGYRLEPRTRYSEVEQ